jgi:excisionase family DNA binding protein
MSATETPPASPWRRVRQRAAELNVGPRTIYNAIRLGELRAAAVNGRKDYVIHDDWIREWLERKATKGVS